MAKTQWNTMNAETLESIRLFANTYATRVAKRDAFRKSVKAYEDIIATDRADLEKLALGKDGVIRTMEVIKTSLQTNLDNVKPLRDAWETEDKACAEIMARVYKTVPETLYKAYVSRETDPTTYTNALKAWCASFGVELTDSTCRVLRETVGDKENDKAMLKDSKTMGLVSEKYDKYARMMCKKVAQLMGGLVTDNQ